jgi:hypothetical protein
MQVLQDCRRVHCRTLIIFDLRFLSNGKLGDSAIDCTCAELPARATCYRRVHRNFHNVVSGGNDAFEKFFIGQILFSHELLN